MFAVTVGTDVYLCRYSLLGLPDENLHWIPSAGIPVPSSTPSHTVLLWFRRNDTWVLYPWLPHLWWTRLLAVSHNRSVGTRAETFAHVRVTSRVLFWWLQSCVPFFL
jgi:hypothetical protein